MQRQAKPPVPAWWRWLPGRRRAPRCQPAPCATHELPWPGYATSFKWLGVGSPMPCSCWPAGSAGTEGAGAESVQARSKAASCGHGQPASSTQEPSEQRIGCLAGGCRRARRRRHDGSNATKVATAPHLEHLARRAGHLLDVLHAAEWNGKGRERSKLASRGGGGEAVAVSGWSGECAHLPWPPWTHAAGGVVLWRLGVLALALAAALAGHPGGRGHGRALLLLAGHGWGCDGGAVV